METIRENNGDVLRVVFWGVSAVLWLDKDAVEGGLEDGIKVVAFDLEGVNYVSETFLKECVELDRILFKRDIYFVMLGLEERYIKLLKEVGGKAIQCFSGIESLKRSRLMDPNGNDVEVTAMEKRALWNGGGS